ncbi:MAG: sulfurtransferase-like selenium metabolism protein YedF [Slackia sp.]|nr:sulfurtransferase-like selenium metabolism protein YedF [Slackia sp.]
MEIIDAYGLKCPKPLMLAKRAIDAGTQEFAVRVDNDTAVANLRRLAGTSGFAAAVSPIEGGFSVAFSRDGAAQPIELAAEDAAPAAPAALAGACGPAGCGYAVFVGKDHIGEGDGELGYNLMKMALYTLAECDDAPASLLFMNAGVKLVAGGEEQVAASVRSLMEQGTEVLVCGTCLDFYGLKDAPLVGEVSNMYDILGRMREAAKVITL